MKQYFSLMLIILVLFSLFGCASDDSSAVGAVTTITTSSSSQMTDATTKAAVSSTKVTTTTATEKKIITYADGKATQPLTGFCGCSNDNKIIIKTDYVGYVSGELTPVEEAYAYQNGELIKLKAFDIELVLRGDALSLNETVTLPVRYFVYESTVYAYAMEWPGGSLKFISIPNDSEHVLLTGGLVKREVLVNVIDGTYEFLTMDFPDYKVLCETMSEDGNYVVMLAGTSYDLLNNTSTSQYVFDFRNKKLTKMPIPEYDSEEFPYTYFRAWTAIDDTVVFTGSFGDRESYDKKMLWYEFDMSNGVVKQRPDLAGFSKEGPQYRPHKYMIFDHDSANGILRTANLKENKIYTVNCEKNTGVSASANERGTYLLLWYFDITTAHRYKIEIVDTKNNKELDMGTVIPNYKENKYRGHHISNIQWCGETALLISYSSDSSFLDQAQFRAEIVELPAF